MQPVPSNIIVCRKFKNWVDLSNIHTVGKENDDAIINVCINKSPVKLVTNADLASKKKGKPLH